MNPFASAPDGLCNNGHPMVEQPIADGWGSYSCDYCGGPASEDQAIEERFRCCEDCPFDLCATCHKFQSQLPMRAEAVFPKGKLIMKWYAANQMCGKNTTLAELGEADGVNFDVNSEIAPEADDKLFWCYGYRGADNPDTNGMDDRAMPCDRDGVFWNILDKDIILTNQDGGNESGDRRRNPQPACPRAPRRLARRRRGRWQQLL